MSAYKAESVKIDSGGVSSESEKPNLTDSIYLRVKEHDASRGVELPEGISSAIDFTSKKDVTAKEVIVEGEQYWVAYSKPVWYVESDRNFHLVDVLVIGASEPEALAKMSRIKAEAEEHRQRMQAWIKETILPEIEKMPNVVAAMGRGSIYDLERVLVASHGNANIILFTDAGSDSEAASPQLLERIQALADLNPDTHVGCSIYRLQTSPEDRGYFSERVEISTSERPDKALDLAIISLPLVLELAQVVGMAKVKKFIGPYSFKAFTEGLVLLDKTDGVLLDFQEQLKTFS